MKLLKSTHCRGSKTYSAPSPTKRLQKGASVIKYREKMFCYFIAGLTDNFARRSFSSNILPAYSPPLQLFIILSLYLHIDLLSSI